MGREAICADVATALVRHPLAFTGKVDRQAPVSPRTANPCRAAGSLIEAASGFYASNHMARDQKREALPDVVDPEPPSGRP